MEIDIKVLLEDIRFARNLPKDNFYDISQKIFIMDKVLERFEKELSKINLIETLIWYDASKILPSYDFDCIVKFERGGIYVAEYQNGKWIRRGETFEEFNTIVSWAMFPE